MSGAAPDPRVMLRAEHARLRAADPFTVLGVTLEADPETIRRAYLALTKRLHPTRFAREDKDVRELANEVFLLVRRAHDELASDTRRNHWKDRLAPARPGMPRPRPANTVPPVVGGTPAAGTRLPSSSTVPPLNVGRPGVTPASGVVRTPPGTTPPSQSGAVAAPLAAGRSGGVSMPQTAAGSQRFGAARPTPGGGTIPPPPARVPTPPPHGPNAIRRPTTGVVADAQRAQLDRENRFEAAARLLGMGQYRKAREALFQIASEEPQNKRYRARLGLAWGLEHLAEGRLEEARRELERALQLEPELDDAKSALARVDAAQPKTGLFNKLFRK